MGGAFHQILSQLRKNKRVSQREVASDLYISQALLSHYENGIREPGLDFVNRACNYYGVTADFLLGRTEADLVESLWTGGDGALFDAKTLVSMLLALGQLERESLTDSVLRCYGAVTYRLLRHVARSDPDMAARLSVPETRVAALSDLELRLGEMQFLDSLEALSADRGPGVSKDPLLEQMEALLIALDGQLSQSAAPREPAVTPPFSTPAAMDAARPSRENQLRTQALYGAENI